ncbi:MULTISPECIES: hypothetical protein [unclassified Rhodanobacter]|uniref:hypothetical protein n=1 Tax=unclassified Rhodanobacter TaxID=2621553 RepID=UPI001BDEB0C3|nr:MULTISPECIES: hypothetical protein [unclassified Rhodanobacter]MBT2142704.1 hypothetical protein [Rhodanobacter sp. LX-99]MBT2148223.1 hypothetical protein [Rhodanobacter sp. LX-100]
MIERKQLYRHKPEEGQIGDCFRTSIACLLDLEPAAVPHFGVSDFDASGRAAKHSQTAEAEAWLAERGLAQVHVAYGGELDDVLAAVGSLNPKAYYLLGGRSRTGVNHAVIGCGNRIAWDPSLTDAGIVGPCSDGLFWVTFIVPSLLVAA